MSHRNKQVPETRVITSTVTSPHGSNARLLCHSNVSGGTVTNIQAFLRRHAFSLANIKEDRWIWFSLGRRKFPDQIWCGKTTKALRERMVDRLSFNCIKPVKPLRYSQQRQSIESIYGESLRVANNCYAVADEMCQRIRYTVV